MVAEHTKLYLSHINSHYKMSDTANRLYYDNMTLLEPNIPYHKKVMIVCENTSITRTGTKYILISLSSPITVKSLTMISIT